MKPDITHEQLLRQLTELGVKPGAVLVVHCAFSRVRPIANGPAGLIAALQAAVTDTGTLVMPSMSDEDDHPFDPRCTPCNGMGIVASAFWQRPGVLRSDSPHAFAASGPLAAPITAPHPIDIPHGMDSPIGRVHTLDGTVLLLGVGHDADTAIHLAETMAGVRYRIPKHATIIKNGQPTRIDYAEIDHCCRNFRLLDEWLDRQGRQRRGEVGYAPARLARVRDIVDCALSQLRENETVFLHPPGRCGECDEARISLM